MNKKVLVSIIAAAAVILAATAAYMMTRPTADNNTVDDTVVDKPMSDIVSPEASNDSSEQMDTPLLVIMYSDSGFEPSPLTVKKGTTITVTNNSSSDLMFASADHPAHQDNTELNIDTIEPGKSGTVVITKTGTWGYHNHDNAEHAGQIIVTE